jgi:hypothetical protein
MDETNDASELTTAEQACFEAGIKFGSLYHQFAGTPVSPASAEQLATGIAASIEHQPHCESVSATIKTDKLREEIEAGSASYTELTGRFLDVEITVEYDGCVAVAEIVMEDGYPQMVVTELDRPAN